MQQRMPYNSSGNNNQFNNTMHSGFQKPAPAMNQTLQPQPPNRQSIQMYNARQPQAFMNFSEGGGSVPATV